MQKPPSIMSSYYISYANYLDKWGPYKTVFINLQGCLARNKEYTKL